MSFAAHSPCNLVRGTQATHTPIVLGSLFLAAIGPAAAGWVTGKLKDPEHDLRLDRPVVRKRITYQHATPPPGQGGPLVWI